MSAAARSALPFRVATGGRSGAKTALVAANWKYPQVVRLAAAVALTALVGGIGAFVAPRFENGTLKLPGEEGFFAQFSSGGGETTRADRRSAASPESDESEYSTGYAGPAAKSSEEPKEDYGASPRYRSSTDPTSPADVDFDAPALPGNGRSVPGRASGLSSGGGGFGGRANGTTNWSVQPGQAGDARTGRPSSPRAESEADGSRLRRLEEVRELKRDEPRSGTDVTAYYEQGEAKAKGKGDNVYAIVPPGPAKDAYYLHLETEKLQKQVDELSRNKNNEGRLKELSDNLDDVAVAGKKVDGLAAGERTTKGYFRPGEAGAGSGVAPTSGPTGGPGAAPGLGVPTPATPPPVVTAGPDAKPGADRPDGGEKSDRQQQDFTAADPKFTPDDKTGDPAKPAEPPVENAPGTPETPKPEPKPDPTPKPPPAAEDPGPRVAPPPKIERKIIRNGDLEFEIEAFDTAVSVINKVAAEEGGIVATVNSDKLANGKVQGTVIVRCPPDRLDTLVLKLRALGDLKSQRLTSQDVTKAFYDLDSRLRAARAMEERLLRIIRNGQGPIKDLIEAEKQLGEWRTRIETYEGELRYLSSLVSQSTLTLTLTERDIRRAAAAVETERVTMGIEAEDVQKAYSDALAAIEAAKGRIVKSDLRKHAEGQFIAVVEADVAPEAAGALTDRLRQLGRVARMESARATTSDGTGLPDRLKVKRQETRLALSLYNLAGVAPRETVVASIAVEDAAAAFARLLARVEKLEGRIVSSNLLRRPDERTTGTLSFELKAGAAADAVQEELKGYGETVKFNTVENADVENTTRSKRGFQVTLLAPGLTVARLGYQVTLAARDVPTAYRGLTEFVAKSAGRSVAANLDESDRSKLSAVVVFEVRPEKEAEALAAVGVAGETLSRVTRRAPDGDTVVEGKRSFTVSIVDAARIAPRETTSLQIAVTDVPAGYAKLRELLAKSATRILTAQLQPGAAGTMQGTLDFEVRREDEPTVSAALASSGKALSRSVQRAAENETVLDSKVRLSVTLLEIWAVAPRETTVLTLAASDVAGTYGKAREVLARVPARIHSAKLEQGAGGSVVGILDFEVRREDEPAVTGALASAHVLSRNVQRAEDTQVVLDDKVRLRIDLVDSFTVRPRDTVQIALEVSDVAAAASALSGLALDAKGRVLEARTDSAANGQQTATLVFDIPLTTSLSVQEKVRLQGKVKSSNTSQDRAAPEGPAALARLHITLGTEAPIIAKDDGLWPQIRRGLTASAAALGWSVQIVVIGACFVLPVALIVWIIRRSMRGTPVAEPALAVAGGGAVTASTAEPAATTTSAPSAPATTEKKD